MIQGAIGALGAAGAAHAIARGVAPGSRSRGANIFFSIIPVPEQLYARYKDLELIASRRVIIYASWILYGAVLISFAGLTYMYFVQELNYVKISPGEATMAGYECVPLTGDEFYGNTFTKAECEKNWREPSTESVDFSSRKIAQDFSKDPQSPLRWTTADGVGKVVYNPFATQKTEGLAGDEEGNYIPFTGEGGGGDGHSSSRRLLAGGGPGSGGGSGNDCGRSFCSNFNAGWHGDDNVNSVARMSNGMYIRWNSRTSKNFIGICAPPRDNLNNQITLGGSATQVTVDCTTSTATADWIQMFKDLMTTYDAIKCHYTIRNPPYVCSKSEGNDWPMILALANNTAALLYTFLAIALIKAVKGTPTERGELKHWVKKLPLPPEMYNERYDLTFVTSDRTAGIISLFLYVVSGVSFVYFFFFFSDPGNYEIGVLLSGVHELDGYDCRPTQPHQGFYTNHTYAECLTKIRDVSLDTVSFATIEARDETNLGTRVYNSQWLPFKEQDPGKDYMLNDFSGPPPLIPGSIFEDMTKPSEFATYNLGSTGIRAWEAAGEIQTWRSTDKGLNATAFVTRTGSSWDASTKAQAVEIWAKMKEHAGDKICDYTKSQPPYVCDEIFEKFSSDNILNAAALAFGMAQLVYAVLSNIIVILCAERNRMSQRPIRSLKPDRTWLSRIPVIEKFYELNALDLISTPKVVFITFLTMCILGAATFAWTYLLYSAKRTTEVVALDGYKLDGYVCQPTITSESGYGPQTAGLPPWSIPECKAKLQKPDRINTGLLDLKKFTGTTYDTWTKGFGGWTWGPGGTTAGNKIKMQVTTNKYSTPYDHIVKLRPWGREYQSIDWYPGCTSDCEPQCTFAYDISGTGIVGISGNIQEDWPQKHFNCKHNMTAGDGSSNFDAWFTSYLNAKASSFNTGTCAQDSGTANNGAITSNVCMNLKADPIDGVHVHYENQDSKNEDAVIALFTQIYDELGEDNLCAWVKAMTPQACSREVAMPLLEVLGMAFGNAELVVMVFITLAPLFIMQCCGVKSTYRDKEGAEHAPAPVGNKVAPAQTQRPRLISAPAYASAPPQTMFTPDENEDRQFEDLAPEHQRLAGALMDMRRVRSRKESSY